VPDRHRGEDRHGDAREDQRREGGREDAGRGPRAPCTEGPGEVGLEGVELAGETGRVDALEAGLELIDVQPAGRGVRGEAIGGGGPLAVTDAHVGPAAGNERWSGHAFER
jgi:hypothetical protein